MTIYEAFPLAEGPGVPASTAAMSFPFLQASWGAQPQLLQASLSPNGMSVLPAQPGTAGQQPPLPQLPASAAQTLDSGPGVPPTTGAAPTAGGPPPSVPGSQTWYPTSAATSQQQAPEVAQGISFTKMLEDHLQ